MRQLDRTLLVFAATLMACGGNAPPPAAQPTALPPGQVVVPAARPAAVVAPAPPDEGVFRLYQNEQLLITSRFHWPQGGRYEGTYTLTLGGQSVTREIVVQPDSAGGWQRVTAGTPRGPLVITRQKDQAVVTVQEKSRAVTLKPGTLLYANFAPALLRDLVRRYDLKQSGPQTVPLLVVEAGQAFDVVVAWKDSTRHSVAGREGAYSRFVVDIKGTELTVIADAEGKVYAVEVAAQHVRMVRDGYDALLAAAPADPLLSRPEHQVEIERGVKVRMRDGVALSTDIYRPKGSGKYPVVLLRTPYRKEMMDPKAQFFARRGYVTAVQDVRGRFGSEGKWEPWVNEPLDGYDAVEWVAAQPWSTGKVGMIGGSYVAYVQWAAASRRPPHLVTIIPNVTPPDPFLNIPYEYGAYFMFGNIWWTEVVESNATGDLSGAAMARIGERRYAKLLTPLPVVDLDQALFGRRSAYWRECIAHPTNDAYWQRASFLERLKEVKLPVFHQSGWFDGDGIGTKLAYARMAAARHPFQKLVLGPWGHTDTATRQHQDRDYGPQAVIDLQREYLRWFDRWLKGVDNGIDKEPQVKIFAMGSNRWLEGNTYPLEKTRVERWYFASGGHAQTAQGDGTLTRDVPRAGADVYVYDPADPTPSPDYFEAPEQQKGTVISQDERKRVAAAYHEQVTRERRDILVYQTKPFAQPYTFAGPLSAVIYASSTGKDTDWFVALYDVEPNGKLLRLVQGKIRARFRQSLSRPRLLTPGKIERYEIDLWQTGLTVLPGHRLRVEVASAAFPLFSRNLNTGGHNEMETKLVKATQTVYHDAKHPSHLVLPAIP